MRQCEFNDVNLPCTRCAERGVPCSKEDKVYPPLRQAKEARLHAEQLEPEAEELDGGNLAQITPPTSEFLVEAPAGESDSPSGIPAIPQYIPPWGALEKYMIPGDTPTTERCRTCSRPNCGFQRWREHWRSFIPILDFPPQGLPSTSIYPPSAPYSPQPSNVYLQLTNVARTQPPAPFSVNLPAPPPPNVGVFGLFKSSLASVVETTQTYLQSAWSSINDAQASLLKIGPVVETAERIISSAVPFTGELKIAYFYHISEWVEALHHLNVKGAWDAVGKAWALFTEKMQGMSSAAAALGSKCAPHLSSAHPSIG